MNSPENPRLDPEVDVTEPLQERKSELSRLYERNVSSGNPPYANVVIHSLGELLWIFQQRGWSGTPHAKNAQRANLSRAIIRGVNLGNVELYGANLSHSQMKGTNLRGAIIGEANLEGADLLGACLSRTYLSFSKLNSARLARADLQGALLGDAKLVGADLESAQLRDANLSQADLSDANLVDAQFGPGTILAGITLNDRTRVRDTQWNGVPLARVDWDQISALGDELDIKRAKLLGDGGQLARAYRDVARTYRGLSLALSSQSISYPASLFRLKSRRFERAALRVNGKLGQWLFSLILELVAGYGERPGRSLLAYIIAIVGFTVTYLVVAQATAEPLSIVTAVILSFSSFHGRGFFPSSVKVGYPLSIVATLEAIVGLFIELIFIATFSRRFLDS